MGPGYGWMHGMGWIWLIIVIILLVVIGYLAAGMMRGRDASERERREIPHDRTESAFDILQKRYARGEITRDEYRRMKEDLKGE